MRPPLGGGGLEATYGVHLRLIGKVVDDFLLVIIKLFSLGAFVLSQYTRLAEGRTDGRTDRQNLDSNTVRIYASHSRTVKTSPLRMHCNSRQLEGDAAQSIRFNLVARAKFELALSLCRSAYPLPS